MHGQNEMHIILIEIDEMIPFVCWNWNSFVATFWIFIGLWKSEKYKYDLSKTEYMNKAREI